MTPPVFEEQAPHEKGFAEVFETGVLPVMQNLQVERRMASGKGRRAAALVIIGILLLLFSGAIEGFLSPSEAPFSIKLGTGLLTGALMWGYLLFAGQVNRENKSLGA